MKRRALLALPVILVVALGGGYLAARHLAQQRLAQTLATVKQALGPGADFTYSRAEPDVLHQGAIIHDVVYNQAGWTVTATDVAIDGAVSDGARRVVAHDVKNTGPGGTVSIRSLIIHDLHLAAGAVSADPAALRFDRMDLNGVLAQETGNHTPPRPRELRAESIVFTKYAAGQPGGFDARTVQLIFEVNQFYGYAGDRVVKVADWQDDGVDLPAAVASLQTGNHWTQLGHNTVSVKKLELDAGYYSSNMEMKPLLRIGSLDTVSQPTGAGQTEFTSDVKKIEFTSGGISSGFSDLGYQAMQADLHVAGHYDWMHGALSIAPMDLTLPNAGIFHLNADLNDLPTQSQRATAATMLQSSLSRLDFVYTDQSLMDRILTYQARQRGMTLRQFKDQLHTEVAVRTRTAAPELAAMAQSVVNFIDTPGTLEISAHPDQPMPMLQFAFALADPDSAVKALHLRVVSH